MPTIVCPNRGLQEWKDLAKEIGEDRAYLAFFRNGDQIPTVEMAKGVLRPKPAVVKSPLEILSTATQVKVTAPKAATSIRVTRPDGKSVVVPLQGTGSINKGDNPLRGETWKKIEAGTIAVSGTAKGQFRRLDGDAAKQVTVIDKKAPGSGGAFPTLDWKPFTTKAGKVKYVAPAIKAFWDWWNANGKGDNNMGVRPSKWQGEWQVWSNKPIGGNEAQASLSQASTDVLISYGFPRAVRNKFKRVNWERIVELGETESWREAGYITPEGQLIDLSGKNEGGPAGMRSYDHREAGGTPGMMQAMAAGLIRISTPSSGGHSSVDLAAKPTRIQLRKLFDLFQYANGNVALDLNDGIGKWDERNESFGESKRRWSNEYDNADPETILEDVMAFYEGHRPGVGAIQAMLKETAGLTQSEADALSKEYGETQPQASLTVRSPEQLRAALPGSGLSTEQQTLISAFLDSPLGQVLEGVRIHIADTLATGWQGSYFDGLVELARNADIDTAPHEFAHRVWELLPEETHQQFEQMRVDEINRRLAQPGNATLIPQLEKLRAKPTTGGGQFIELGYDRSIYNLSSAEEFFTHSFSDKFTGENLNPQQRTMWQRVKDLFHSIIAAIKKFFKLPQSQDELLTNIMAGRYDVTPEGSVTREIQASIPKETAQIEEEKRAQVAGMPEIGQVRPTENIEETTKRIQDTLFDGSKPVSKEATDKAWNIFAEMTDPATKSGRAQQVKNQLGGSRIGLSLYKGEVMNYAFKLAVNGDSALFRAMLDHSEEFETLTGGGASTAGSALRGEGEFASEPAVKSLKDIFTVERQRAAAKGLGVDQNTLLELIKQLSDLQLSPDDLEAVINEGKTPDGRTIRDLLGENEPTPEEKTRRGRQMVDEEAQSVAERELARFELKHADVEWLKQPNKRNAVLKIIADALKSDAPIDVNPLPFIQDIQSKLVDVGVDENTAGQLAHEITVERTTRFVNARAKLMNRAANSNNIRSLIESILTMPYRAQSDPVWLHDTAVRWFESNGLAKEQAEAASRIFAKQFAAAFQAARERIGNSILAKANPSNHEDLMKLIRLGKDWLDKLAEQHGWIKPTDAQFKQLSDLQEKWSNPELSPPERNAIMEQMNRILRHIGNHDKSWLIALGESQAASLLSGLRTIDLHLFQPITSMLVRDLPTALLSRPQDLPMLVKNLLTASKNFFPELKFAWQKDAFGFNDAKMYGYHSELKRQFEIGVEEWKKGNYKGALRLVYAWQQYVFRALQTANQAGMAVKREFALSLYGSQVMRDAGFTTKQIGELCDVVPSLKEAAYADGVERLGLDPNTARVRADHLVSEQLQDFFANKVGDNLASQAARAAELDAYSATGFKAPGIKETDEGWLSNKLGINKLMQYMRDLRKEGGLSSIVGITGFGFVNVPLRMARFNANFFGYGILRWGVYKYRMARGLETPWKQSFANETQARQRLLEGIIGSLIGFGFLGWAWNNSTADDNRKKKFFIYATGHGPLNKTLKDAWLKEGYRPFSLIIGLDGKVIGNVPIIRVGGALAWPMGISAAEDDHAWAKKDAEANGRKFNETVAGDLAQMAGTYYEIIGAQGIFQGISHLQQLSQGGGGMAKVLASSLSGVAASIAIPGKQLIAGVSQMIWGNPDRSSVEAAIAANFPIIGAPWLHPQINRLGDPLGDNTWYGKISNLGLPIAFRVSDNPVNRELYQTLLDKGVAPADLRRTLVEERYGPLTDEQFTQFAKTSGASIKDALAGNLTQLQGMSAPDAKKFVAKAVQTADLQSASDLGLVREVSAKGKLAGNEFAGTTPARSASGARRSSVLPRRSSALRPARRSLYKPKYAKLGRIKRGRMSALRGRKSSLYGSLRKRHVYA